jgi:nicotinate-nucleotide adenylyltransferase
MNIALFGGAFDPPHLGHEQVVAALLDNHIVDEVWYVPVRQHPFSKPLQATDQQRTEMLQLLSRPSTRIETYELASSEISYAYFTLQAMAQQHPAHTFSWVIGSDNLQAFHKWGFYESILEKFTVYVYPRAKFPMEPLYDGMVPLTSMPEVEISSTLIREKLIADQPVEGLVNAEVAAYIANHQLYR